MRFLQFSVSVLVFLATIQTLLADKLVLIDTHDAEYRLSRPPEIDYAECLETYAIDQDGSHFADVVVCADPKYRDQGVQLCCAAEEYGGNYGGYEQNYGGGGGGGYNNYGYNDEAVPENDAPENDENDMPPPADLRGAYPGFSGACRSGRTELIEDLLNELDTYLVVDPVRESIYTQLLEISQFFTDDIHWENDITPNFHGKLQAANQFFVTKSALNYDADALPINDYGWAANFNRSTDIHWDKDSQIAEFAITYEVASTLVHEYDGSEFPFFEDITVLWKLTFESPCSPFTHVYETGVTGTSGNRISQAHTHVPHDQVVDYVTATSNWEFSREFALNRICQAATGGDLSAEGSDGGGTITETCDATHRPFETVEECLVALRRKDSRCGNTAQAYTGDTIQCRWYWLYPVLFGTLNDQTSEAETNQLLCEYLGDVSPGCPAVGHGGSYEAGAPPAGGGGYGGPYNDEKVYGPQGYPPQQHYGGGGGGSYGSYNQNYGGNYQQSYYGPKYEVKHTKQKSCPCSEFSARVTFFDDEYCSADGGGGEYYGSGYGAHYNKHDGVDVSYDHLGTGECCEITESDAEHWRRIECDGKNGYSATLFKDKACNIAKFDAEDEIETYNVAFDECTPYRDTYTSLLVSRPYGYDCKDEGPLGYILPLTYYFKTKHGTFAFEAETTFKPLLEGEDGYGDDTSYGEGDDGGKDALHEHMKKSLKRQFITGEALPDAANFLRDYGTGKFAYVGGKAETIGFSAHEGELTLIRLQFEGDDPYQAPHGGGYKPPPYVPQKPHVPDGGPYAPHKPPQKPPHVPEKPPHVPEESYPPGTCTKHDCGKSLEHDGVECWCGNDCWIYHDCCPGACGACGFDCKLLLSDESMELRKRETPSLGVSGKTIGVVGSVLVALGITVAGLFVARRKRQFRVVQVNGGM